MRMQRPEVSQHQAYHPPPPPPLSHQQQDAHQASSPHGHVGGDFTDFTAGSNGGSGQHQQSHETSDDVVDTMDELYYNGSMMSMLQPHVSMGMDIIFPSANTKNDAGANMAGADVDVADSWVLLSQFDVVANVETSKSVQPSAAVPLPCDSGVLLSRFDAMTNVVSMGLVQASAGDILPEAPTDVPRMKLRSTIKRAVGMTPMMDITGTKKLKQQRYEPRRPMKRAMFTKFKEWCVKGENQSVDLTVPGALVEETVDGHFVKDVTLVTLNVQWFQILMTPGALLHYTHFNAYMDLLRRRMDVHPSGFNEDIYICYLQMSMCLPPAFVKYSRAPNEYDWTAERSSEHMETVKKWTRRTRSLVVWRVNPEHCVTVEMSIPEWTLKVYDGFIDSSLDAKMNQGLKCWARMLHVLIRVAGVLTDVPQMLLNVTPPFTIVLLEFTWID